MNPRVIPIEQDRGDRDLALLRPEDIGYAYNLCEATMRDSIVALWGHWPEDQVKEEMLRAITKGEYHAVIHEGARVGLVSVLWDETCCEIVQLFIEPKFQRRGAGRLTVDGIVHQAALRGGRSVIARVLVTNPARSFWEKAGFVLVDSTTDHHLMEHKPSITTAKLFTDRP